MKLTKERPCKSKEVKQSKETIIEHGEYTKVIKHK